MNMLQPYVAARFRAGGTNEQGNGFDLKVATGRAACRCCGEKISKGTIAFTGYYDFTGNYGSWTSTPIWFHQHDCTPPTP